MEYRQNLFPEDPEDLMITLSEDLKKTYLQLARWEELRDERKDDLNAFVATMKGVSVSLWSEQDKRQQSELSRLASEATREITKHKDLICLQVGHAIDAMENGTRRTEAMKD